jgi:hypothetical protein
MSTSSADILRLPASTTDVCARSLRDEDFASLGHLQQLQDLNFDSGWADPKFAVRFSTKGLAVLASLDLPHLDTLFFGHCNNITDAGLVEIIKLKSVRTLGLVECPGITDAGLHILANMPNLNYLDLHGNQNITDKGLEFLSTKSSWGAIRLVGCSRVTPQAIADLRRKFPNAQIVKEKVQGSGEQD